MNILKVFLFFFFIQLIAVNVFGSIYCPSSKTLDCHDDIHNLTVTGKATTSGYPAALIKYTDTKTVNKCNIGTIIRIWYIDTNQDNTRQASEPNCTQIIYVSGGPSPISIDFPGDKAYQCKEMIANEKPVWTTGPCDVMGVQVSDTKYDVFGESCFKILRKYTVINWCDYTGSTGSPGVWTHTQKISVKENNPPKISRCSHEIFGSDSDCLASVTLKNAASDDPMCKSPLLSWVVEVDLWANGTQDYKFGFTESGIYKIDPVADGTEIKINIPVKLKAGKHKVKWTVRDACGNYSTCNTTFETKDNKPPTPYVQDFITAAFQASAMPLMISPRLFDHGSFDNCTAQKDLKFSFSEDIHDTLRIVDCSNAGFQFFYLYIWDEAGNYEFIDVYMLVFDNGSCQGSRSLEGNITESNLLPVKNAEITLTRGDKNAVSTYSDEKGKFNWKNISIYDDYIISAKNVKREDHRLDIADLRMLQDFIFGLKIFKNYEWIAADIDGDKTIGVQDLNIIKSTILQPEKVVHERWKFITQIDTSSQSEAIFKSLKSSINIKELKKNLLIKAVYAGDLSDANEVKSISRNMLGCFVKKDIDNIAVHLEKEMKISGIQLKFKLDADPAKVRFTSVYPQINENQFYYNSVSNEFTFLNTADIEIKSDLPLFVLKYSETAHQRSVSILSDSKILSEGYQTHILQQRSINPKPESVFITPNPGLDDYQIQGHEQVEIIDLSDFSGRKIRFTQNQNQLNFQGASGVYFLKIKTSEGQQIIKLLKI